MERNDKKFDNVIKMYDNAKVVKNFAKRFQNGEQTKDRADLFIEVVFLIFSLAMVIVGTQVSKTNIVISTLLNSVTGSTIKYPEYKSCHNCILV